MDAKRWRSCAWLRELVQQWHAARGYAEPGNFQRPFSRDWEELLESSGLLSAEARNEAFRDARVLESASFIELKTERYRPYQIERVIVPFASEARLRELFNDELPAKPEASFDPASVAWAQQLAFLTATRTGVAPEDLLKLNAFLLNHHRSLPVVPIKERSLQIFGDEKRLDALLSTSLFRNGRLDLKNDLHCEIVGEPLGWRRGPTEATTQPLIVIENAGTWHSYCRWNAERKFFSAVVYGCGNRFADGVHYLAEIFAELGGQRRVLYFGDLDPQGLLIPQEASGRAQAAGMPTIEPHLWSYRQLLTLGAGRSQPWEGEPPSSSLCDWLQSLAEPARQLFATNRRLAQEHVGWEFLRQHVTDMD
ncbi:MAG TPA: Wadjet anti-phage system protein JetD domain-containing protein [Verrucomicrobiae bacterium]